MESSSDRVKVLKLLDEHTWAWRWTGNWPLLDLVNHEKEMAKISGFTIKYYADFFNGPILSVYTSKDEEEEANAIIKEKYKLDPKALFKPLDEFDRRYDADIKKLHEISDIISSVENPNPKSLTKLFKEARACLPYNIAIDQYCGYLESSLIPILKEYIIGRLSQLNKDKSEVSLYLTRLTTPLKPTEFSFERESFFRILGAIKSKKIKKVNSKEAFKQFILDDLELKKLVLAHHEKFNWLHILANGKPQSPEELYNELFDYMYKDREKYNAEVTALKRLLDGKAIIEAKETIKELKPNNQMLALIQGLQTAAYARTQTGVVTSKSTSFLVPIYTAVAQRLGVSYSELKLLLPEEIIGLLEREGSAEELVKQRRQLTAYIASEYILSGADAKVILGKITEKVEKKAAITEILNGTPASLGIVRGKVRIILNSSQANKIIKGEILVAKATSVDFVPAMRRSAAIITETGGITSHAAIISRELGVPCIIGVENATRMLNNGDLVDLDATNGTIKILKRNCKQ
ncbi:MAG: PEP-utilizing enzyme [Candidatus Marsarchaeota archaeon]|nr:PEP-utilizing enzyme [Candidatus Marsarchaeota archaeon]